MYVSRDLNGGQVLAVRSQCGRQSRYVSSRMVLSRRYIRLTLQTRGMNRFLPLVPIGF